MRITIKHEGKLYRTNYRASNGYNGVNVSVYDWPWFKKVHVVACDYGHEPLSFFAESFSAEDAVNLLKVYAKAYL